MHNSLIVSYSVQHYMPHFLITKKKNPCMLRDIISPEFECHSTEM